MSADSPNAGAVEHAHHRAFGRAYWMLNSIEMFERLAYYGIRTVVPIYIMQATEPGGLHLTALHKGWIYAWWAVIQSFLPMVTGGYADRFGYKRVLACSISLNVVGYLIMASMHSYYGFFAGIIVLAFGTAFFKPSLQGSLAQNLTKENSSLGWGMFYWVVNIGAFGGPFIATVILGRPHSAEGWRNLFIACAGFTAMNLLLLFTFKDVPSGADKTLSVVKVFWLTIENIWPYWFRGGTISPARVAGGLVLVAGGIGLLATESLIEPTGLQKGCGWLFCAMGVWLILLLRGGRFTWQLRLPAWLLIMSCFWMMMYQLWDLHPNFITDWVDSSTAAEKLKGSLGLWWEYGDRGLLQVPQQILLNLNAGLIILLILPISWLVRKMRTLSSMLIGMSVATTGVLVAGLTGNVWVLLLGITFFSLGEMLTGPKKNEYLGLIAPPGKKGLYLGYVNIPIGIGVGIGSWIAGIVYDNYGEKATLALKELGARPALVGRAARSMDWSDSLDKLSELIGVPRDGALSVAQKELGVDTEAAAEQVRDDYRYDQGQIVNLAQRYLRANDRSFNPETKRMEVFPLLREFINRDGAAGERQSDEEIITRLWEQYGSDADVINDLALEYLAQGTAMLADAVDRKLAEIDLFDPVEDLDEHFGIGRTKSFDALSAAVGVDSSRVEEELVNYMVPGGDGNDRLFAYLADRPHLRFLAVAGRDWSNDLPFLEDLIESDPTAKEIVIRRVDERSLWDRTVGAVINTFREQKDRTLYERLSEKQDLIQSVLAAKDWSRTPDQARRLLRLSVPEARTRAAVEVNNAALATTRLLWDSYHPQYRVWIPFATVGVLATIALSIFGRMAKRWKDMNA